MISAVPFIYTGIEISAPNNNAASAAYTHEIAHSQCEVHRATENIRYEEVIPIFLEKLKAYMTDYETFRYIERERLRYMLNKIHHLMIEPGNISDSCYITSTLIAESLFNRFLHSSETAKAKIIDGIQDVFDGKVTLEELLQELKITEQNSRSVAVVKRNLCI